jgi:putative transposase
MNPAPMSQRHSIRLADFDYTAVGAFFVTICTDRQICLFGQVVEDEVRLSSFGQVANREWLRLASRFPGLMLDAFVVMPNHLHAILILWRDRKDIGPQKEAFGHPVTGSIPTIVRAYKSSVALRINRQRGTPGAPVWQRNYWEHVIRETEDWSRIREYVLANPRRWNEDRLAPDDLALS